MLDRPFLEYSVQKLRQAAGRVNESLARLTEDQVWARGTSNENAVGNLVLHLCGNVEQWILGGVGGREVDRDRDAEFAAHGDWRIPELQEKLRVTVEAAVTVIESQSEPTLVRSITVQNYQVTALTAIYHVVEHFAGHAGQILFATKMLTGEDLGFYRHLKYDSHKERTP